MPRRGSARRTFARVMRNTFVVWNTLSATPASHLSFACGRFTCFPKLPIGARGKIRRFAAGLVATRRGLAELAARPPRDASPLRCRTTTRRRSADDLALELDARSTPVLIVPQKACAPCAKCAAPPPTRRPPTRRRRPTPSCAARSGRCCCATTTRRCGVGALPERSRARRRDGDAGGPSRMRVAHRCCQLAPAASGRARAASRRWPCCSRRWSSSAGGARGGGAARELPGDGGRAVRGRLARRAGARPAAHPSRLPRSRASGSAPRRRRPTSRPRGASSARPLLTRVLEPAAARAFLEGDAAALAPAASCSSCATRRAAAAAEADARSRRRRRRRRRRRPRRELRQKIAAEAAADAAADAAVAEPPPPAPARRRRRRGAVGGARAPLAACARATGAQWAAALRRGAAALDGRPAVLAPDVRRALEVAAALIAALTAMRVVAGSSAARAAARPLAAGLCGAALRPCAAAARRERRRAVAD